MKARAIASLDFLLCFAAFAALLSLYSASLENFNTKAVFYFNFLEAKANALQCAIAVDSLASNTAFSVSFNGFECFSDSNNSVASVVKERKALAFAIANSKIVNSASGVRLEVESNAHYK